MAEICRRALNSYLHGQAQFALEPDFEILPDLVDPTWDNAFTERMFGDVLGRSEFPEAASAGQTETERDFFAYFDLVVEESEPCPSPFSWIQEICPEDQFENVDFSQWEPENWPDYDKQNLLGITWLPRKPEPEKRSYPSRSQSRTRSHFRSQAQAEPSWLDREWT